MTTPYPFRCALPPQLARAIATAEAAVHVHRFSYTSTGPEIRAGVKMGVCGCGATKEESIRQTSTARVRVAVVEEPPDEPGRSERFRQALFDAALADCASTFNYTPEVYNEGEKGAREHMEYDARGTVREKRFKATFLAGWKAGLEEAAIRAKGGQQ